MTLIEVAASLALLGTLLGALVLAKGRMNHQWRSAQRRVAAVAALDEQLDRWRAESARTTDAESDADEDRADAPWPRSGEGVLLDEPWWWRAETLEQAADRDGLLSVIRYTAFDPQVAGQPAEATLDVVVLPEEVPDAASVETGVAP